MTTPVVVIRAILWADGPLSVNQRLPSGPAAIAVGVRRGGYREFRDDLAAGDPGQARPEKSQDQRRGASARNERQRLMNRPSVVFMINFLFPPLKGANGRRNQTRLEPLVRDLLAPVWVDFGCQPRNPDGEN